MSYSQYDEENHILAAFPEDKNEGRFLDVGAWHPTRTRRICGRSMASKSSRRTISSSSIKACARW